MACCRSEVSLIACNCGKNKRLPPVVTRGGAEDARRGSHVYFYAVPPEGGGEPVRFDTLREARAAATHKGPGWTIEGRRESVG